MKGRTTKAFWKHYWALPPEVHERAAITPSSGSKSVNELLKKARRANLLARSESGEQFIIAKISSAHSFHVGDSEDFEEEIKTTRANKKLMKFLDERGREAKKGKLISMAQVEKELGLKKRRSK